MTIATHRVLRTHELAQDLGHDLPRQPVLVFEPAALRRLSAGAELVPVGGISTSCRSRRTDGFRELEMRAAVQRHELLSIELNAQVIYCPRGRVMSPYRDTAVMSKRKMLQ